MIWSLYFGGVGGRTEKAESFVVFGQKTEFGM